MSLPRSLTAALCALAPAAAPLTAQSTPTGSARVQSVLLPLQPYAPGPNIDLPQAPRGLLNRPPKHGMPQVPTGGPGLPQPHSPSCREASPGTPREGPGTFKYFHSGTVKPTGASVLSYSEPTAVAVRDTVLFTANKFAAVSEDAGQQWTHVNPLTRFQARDGGFCCDQVATYSAAEDMALWILQYNYSTNTKQGGQLLVRMLGRDGIRSMTGTSPDFANWYIFPGLFGLANGSKGAWLDYPHLGLTQKYLVGSCNVFDGDDKFLSSVVWRLPLTDLKAGRPTLMQFTTTARIGGSSWRLTQNPGATMFFATHKTTSQLRVYKWADTSLFVSWKDVDISQWTQGLGTCTGPDNRDWAGSPMENRIMGAYRKAGEIGFLWHVAPRANRPNAYVRVARIRPSNLTLIGQRDIWNASQCIGYPAATVNARGDIGVTCTWGGANRHVHTSATIFDQYQAWNSSPTFHIMGSGNSGVSLSRFGDYFQVQQHPVYTNTFVGTGHRQVGGAGPNGAEPRFGWFGREEVEPNFVQLEVQASGAGDDNIAIELNREDRHGRSAGTTTFARQFVRRQDYRLEAPLLHTAGTSTYAFLRWSLKNSPSAQFQDQPIGRRSLAVSTIGSEDDIAIAKYVARRTLTVRSQGATDIPISVSLTDIHGNKNGRTEFVREYRLSITPMTLTAPATVGQRQFYRWRRGLTLFPVGQRTLSLTPTINHTVDAIYGRYTPGMHTRFSNGCRGSNGRIPAHFSQATPDIGETVPYRLQFGPFNSAALMVLGFRNDQWNGIPLPFLLPGTTCPISTEVVTMFAAATNPIGFASVPIDLPNARSLIGSVFHTQYWCIDPAANQWGLTTSNGLTTRVGGWTFR